MHGAFFICMVHFLFALYRRHAWRLYRMHGVSIIRMAHFLFARQYIIICTVQTPCMASLSFAWRIFFRMAILSSARYRRHAWRLYRMHGAFFILLLPSPLPPHLSNSFYTPSIFLSLALLTKWQWRFWWWRFL